jgi:type II secretory pathway component GspD/PulD (secretin)
MKKLILRIMAVCAAGLLVPAVAQTTTNETPDEAGSPQMPGADESAPPEMAAPQPDDNAAGQQQATTTQSQGAPPMQLYRQRRYSRPDQSSSTSSASSAQTEVALAPPAGQGSGPDQLRLNFDNVPLDMVLNYLSDAAGFIIIMDTQVHGNVSVISSHPMTRDEAVDLLNSVLNQNGYAAIRNGRTLTIVDKNDAKTRDIPVNIYNGDLASIPKNDEIVTEIVPVRYVDASQLVSDLSSFTSPQATIVANQAGNSIVVTDTQENIRHLVEIVAAVDSSAAGETEIRVFPLKYANPNDVASELGQVFPSGGSGNQLPIRFGGGPGGFGGGFGGGGFGGPGGFFARMAANAGGGGGNSDNRAQKQSQVTAVADPRTQSVVVTASKDLMGEIAGMMDQLDVPSPRDQKVHVVHIDNADSEEILQVLQSTFPQSTTSGSRSSSSSQQTEQSALIQRQEGNAQNVSQMTSQIQSGVSGGTSRGGGGGSTP